MEPIPEVEELRKQLQIRHAEHVQTELALVGTFLDIRRVEYGIGEIESGQKSLTHARQAIDGAWQGIRRIDSSEGREFFRAMIEKRELEIREFELEFPSTHL